MSSRGNVFLSGTLAVAAAALLLVAAGLTGFLPEATTPSANSTNTSTGGNLCGNSTTGQNPASGGSTATPLGTLTLLMTDPPMFPEGVTSLYLQYDQVTVHGSSSAPDGGWTQLNTSGTIDSLSLINVSQTLASAQLTPGSYDAIRFHFSNAQVTLNASNYAATVASGNVTASLQGGIQVRDSQNSLALVDLQPTILEVGSAASPQFVFNAQASLYDPTLANFTDILSIVGTRIDIGSLTWWNGVELNQSGSLQVINGTISMNSLTLTVKNTGNVVQYLSMVMVSSSYSSVLPPSRYQPGYRLPAAFQSMMFSVQPDGSLTMITLIDSPLVPPEGVAQVFSETGYQLAPGSSVTLSYSGTVISAMQNPLPASYLLTVIGSTAQASLQVQYP